MTMRASTLDLWLEDSDESIPAIDYVVADTVAAEVDAIIAAQWRRVIGADGRLGIDPDVAIANAELRALRHPAARRRNRG